MSASAARNVHPDPLCLFSAAAQRPRLEDRTAAAASGGGESPLTLALKAGLAHNVRLLLEHGASPHNANGTSETPLLLGKEKMDVEPVRQAVRGADLRGNGKGRRRPRASRSSGGSSCPGGC